MAKKIIINSRATWFGPGLRRQKGKKVHVAVRRCYQQVHEVATKDSSTRSKADLQHRRIGVSYCFCVSKANVREAERCARQVERST